LIVTVFGGNTGSCSHLVSRKQGHESRLAVETVQFKSDRVKDLVGLRREGLRS
jgi:hypothetical protein